MSETTREGGCQCGAVRFQTSGEPVRVIACHCGTCKLRTGAAYGIGVYFKEEAVRFTGEPRERFEFHSAQSGRWLRNEFCARCGCTVSWTLQLRPGIRGMAGGNFDDPDWFEISAHIWAGSARPDMRYPDHVAVHERGLAES